MSGLPAQAAGERSAAEAAIEGPVDGGERKRIPEELAPRRAVGAGDAVRGPAVVEEYGSTLPVPAGVHVVVDRLGALVVRREEVTR